MECFAASDEDGKDEENQFVGGLVCDVDDLLGSAEDTGSSSKEKGEPVDEAKSIKEEEDEGGSERTKIILPDSDELPGNSVQIITSHVSDIDANSEYMYNNWYTGSVNSSGDGGHKQREDVDLTVGDLRHENDTKPDVCEGDRGDHDTEITLGDLKSDSPSVQKDQVTGRTVELEELQGRKCQEENVEPDVTNSQREERSRRSSVDDERRRRGIKLVDSMLKNANADVSAQKYSKAVAKYEEALTLATELNDLFLVQSCACNLGAVLVILGQAQRAIDILQHQLEDASVRTESSNTNALADIHYNLGLAYDANGEIDSAINSFQQAREEFEKWKNDRGLADAHNQLAELLAKQSNLKAARSNYSKAADLYGRIGNGLMKARMLVKEARMLNAQVDNDGFIRIMATCEKASRAVLKQNTSKGTSTKEAKLFHDMAVLCRKQGHQERALQWLEAAWKRCQAGRDGGRQGREDVRLQAAISQSLARMYMHSYDLISAIEVYQESASLHGAVGNHIERGWCFFHLAEAYRQLCDFTNAERSYHVAHQILSDAGEVDHLWRVAEGLGDLNTSRQHPDIATTYYREALSKNAPLHSRSKSTSEKLIAKLTRALEDQKVSRFARIPSRQKRMPIVVGYDPSGIPHLGEESSETNLDGHAFSTPKNVFKPVLDRYAHSTSTPKGVSPPTRVSPRMRSPSKRKKGKRKGDLLPVTKGVGMYDSGTDLSLVNGSATGIIDQAYGHVGKGTKKGKKSSRYLSVKNRHMQMRSVTPPHSSSSEEEEEDEDSESEEEEEDEEEGDEEEGEGRDKESSDSGFRTMWRRAKELVQRLKSDSSEDSDLSSSADEEEDERKRKMQGRMDEDEGIESKESDRLENTYEVPSKLDIDPIYATIRKDATVRSARDDPIYETLRGGTKTLGGSNGFGASMPTRGPPPPAPPFKTHPSLHKKKKDVNRPSTSHDDEDDDDSFTSVTEDELEELKETLDTGNKKHFPTLSRMTRGGMEAGLWEIQKLEDEREALKKANEPSLSPKTTPEKKQGKEHTSRVCSIM